MNVSSYFAAAVAAVAAGGDGGAVASAVVEFELVFDFDFGGQKISAIIQRTLPPPVSIVGIGTCNTSHPACLVKRSSCEGVKLLYAVVLITHNRRSVSVGVAVAAVAVPVVLVVVVVVVVVV